MEKAACNCVNSTGLDIGAVDIRVQSNTQRDPKFIVCEINSAPALGDLGIIKYKEVITKLINNKGYA
jgi:glutathione synthase/RimK-type ligase-like ATP-grasp enzyme